MSTTDELRDIPAELRDIRVRLEALEAICEQPDPASLIGRVLFPEEPTAPAGLQHKVKMLEAQIRLYTRLRAECMQALVDTQAKLETIEE